MNKFCKYLEDNFINKKSLAKAIGIHYQKINRIAWGIQLPDLQTAYKIEFISKGEIRMQDWFKDNELVLRKADVNEED